MQTIKEVTEKIERLREVRPLTKDERKLKGYKQALKDVLKLIDECDPEPCCHGVNKKELKQKIQGESK